MAARHHFYGKLYVDDIADLAAYVASHAGSAFNWRGTWAPNTSYAVGDAFTYAGSSYLVLTAFTSGTSFAATNLALLAAKGTDGLNGTNGADSTVPGPKGDKGDAGPTGASGLTFRGAWSSSATYAPNDLVTWGGSGYVTSVAKAAGSPPPTGAAADPGLDDTAVNSGWTLLVLEGARGPQGVAGTNGTNGLNGQGFTYRGPWAASTAYVPYDVVTYLGQTFLATTTFTSGATFNASNWTLWAAKGADGAAGTNGTNGTNGQGFTYRGPWATNTVYNAYDILTYAGAAYTVVTGFTSGSTFSTANLSLLVDRGGRGAGLITGHGAPSSSMGGTGDLYLDLDTGILYTDGTTAPATSGAFRFRGAYANDVTYANLDVVTYQGATYAFTDTTSASGKLPTTSSWALLAAAGAPGTAGANGSFTVTPWAAGAAYKVNDTYLRGETLYRAVRAHTATTVSDPAFGALTNVYTDPAPKQAVVATGGGIWSQQLVTDASKSASATGGAIRFFRASTQMPATMDNAAFQTLNFDTAAVAGKKVLVRVHVFSTETHTFRLLFGNYPNPVEPPDARNQYTPLITATANTLTQLNLIATMPTLGSTMPGIAVTPNATESASANSDGSVYYSGFQVTEVPSGYTGDGSDIPFIEGYATGEWTGTVGASASVYRYQREFTPPNVQAPLFVNPRTSVIGLARDTAFYDAKRTYRPGEMVRTVDGSIWEAVSDVAVNTPPIRYNHVPNPVAVASSVNWTNAPVSNDPTLGGDPVIDSGVVAGVSALTFAKAAGTSTSSAAYNWGETPLTINRGAQGQSRTVFTTMQLYSDTALSNVNVLMRQLNMVGAQSAQNTITLGNLPAGVWTTVRGSGLLTTSTTVRTVLQLRSTAVGNVAVNLALSKILFDDSNQSVDPFLPYFDGTSALLSGYTTQAWRGTQNNSPSLAIASAWRFVAPGPARRGAAVMGSAFVGDVDYDYDFGLRTMGL